MQQAINPDTGNSVFLVGNKWVMPDQIAVNEAGNKAYLVGGQWITENISTTPATSENPNPIPGAIGDESKYRLSEVAPINTENSALQTVKDIGSNLYSGVLQGGAMIGKTLKTAAPLIANYSDESTGINPDTSISKERIDQNIQATKNAGQKMADYLGDISKNAQAPYRDRGVIAGALVHGSTAVGMAVPAIAASLIGAPETAVAVGMGLLFGASSYEDKHQDILNNGGSEEDAHHAGLLSGVINGFGGAALSYLSVGLGSLTKTAYTSVFGKSATPTIESVVNTLTNPEILKPFAKAFATRLGADATLFNAQTLADREVSKAYDLPYKHDISKVIKEATGDGITMAIATAPLGAWGAYRSSQYRSSFGDALNNPSIDPNTRTYAVMTTATVAKNAGVPEKTINNWMKSAAESIANKAPIDVSGNSVTVEQAPSEFNNAKPITSEQNLNDAVNTSADSTQQYQTLEQQLAAIQARKHAAADHSGVGNSSPIVDQMQAIRPLKESPQVNEADVVNAPSVDDAIAAANKEVNAADIPVKESLTIDHIQPVLDSINPKLSTGEVKVVPTTADLPDHIQQRIDANGAPVEGVYTEGSGKVHLVADAFDNLDRVHQVLGHELIGNLAPTEIIDPKIYSNAINSVIAMDKAGNANIQKLGAIVDERQDRKSVV